MGWRSVGDERARAWCWEKKKRGGFVRRGVVRPGVCKYLSLCLLNRPRGGLEGLELYNEDERCMSTRRIPLGYRDEELYDA
jgi:hypothetical protein